MVIKMIQKGLVWCNAVIYIAVKCSTALLCSQILTSMKEKGTRSKARVVKPKVPGMENGESGNREDDDDDDSDVRWTRSR